MTATQTAHWCILRCASTATLPLVKALAEEGFAAWSPTEVQRRRARRAIPASDVTVALMPSMVFADHARLVDLIALARGGLQHRVWDAALRRHVVHGVPHFRVLRVGDRYARVGDGELSGLRRAESVGLTLVKAKTFRPGVTVRLLEGAGEGLRGQVESVSGIFAMVQFSGFSLAWKVAFHLLEVAQG